MNKVEPTEHRLTLPEVVDALVADGLVASDAAATFKQERRYYKGEAHPLIVIAEQRWKSLLPPHPVLDIDTLTQWLAKWSGLGYLHIDPLKINFSAVTEVMSNIYATRFRILPVDVRSNEVVIATAEPFQRAWEAEMQPILRKDIRRVIANPEDITRYLVEFYNLARSIKGAMSKGDVAGGASNFEQLVEMGKSNKQFDANDSHIVTIVDWLWQYAFEQRASDIHVEPRRDLGIVRFRIDGVLHQVYQIPKAVLNAMTSRIKVLGRMDVVEKRRPQDGRIKTRTADGQEVELRLATVPTAFGEKLVMRIFDPEVLVRDFSELGFAADELAMWNGMAAQPNGIILVTGPTGSGKTVTLYSTLKQLATPQVNVCTLEDPIEMVEASFNQIQIQPEIGIGFAEGIRALMRQDPDIIMVGEIRDIETADMAIQAALTGHLVLSTLHTNSAPESITRLLEIGLDPFMFSDSLLAVLAQRLVRRLCKACRQPEPMPAPQLETMVRLHVGSAIGASAASEVDREALVSDWQRRHAAPDGTLRHWRRIGCPQCGGSGYHGRLGLHELLTVDEPLRGLIRRRAPASDLQRCGLGEGRRTLRQDGIDKVLAGLTDLPEVLTATNQ
jgi:general secretion pathway protein E